jgi:hypothetical protein
MPTKLKQDHLVKNWPQIVLDSLCAIEREEQWRFCLPESLLNKYH